MNVNISDEIRTFCKLTFWVQWREHIDKSDKSVGSGMGLVLVSNMLAESKMRLRFENVNGGGTLAGVVLV